MKKLYLKPSVLAFTGAASSLLLSAPALAACVESPAGVFECSGTETQPLFLLQDGSIDLTTTSSYNSSNVLKIENSTLGTGVKFTQEAGGSISANAIASAIDVRNNGTGSTLIETSGMVTNSNGVGVLGANYPTALDLTINQKGGVINAAGDGIRASNWGTGFTSVTVAGEVTSSKNIGVNIETLQSSKSLSISQKSGDITGYTHGLNALHQGTGSTNVSIAGNIAAVGVNPNDIVKGVDLYSDFDTTDFTFTQAASSTIQSTGDALVMHAQGVGFTSIEMAGNAFGSTNSSDLTAGVFVLTAPTSQGLLLVQKSGSSIIGSGEGIVVSNGGGSAVIETSGDILATKGFGITALTRAGSDNLVINQRAGTIEGEQIGVLLTTLGDGFATLTSSGTIAGGIGAVVINRNSQGDINIVTTETGELRNTSGLSVDPVIVDWGDNTVKTNIDNTGKITGTVKLGQLNNSFKNQRQGVWNTAGGTNQFGSGALNTLSNDGAIIAANIAATAPVTTTFNGLARFTNTPTGILVMANGIVGDKTVISGDYVGNGGVITFDTMLGDDNSTTDLLSIQGHASGNTIVEVNNVGGAGAPTVEGIKLIEVVGNSMANGFALVGDYIHEGQPAKVAGAHAYKLYQHGVSTPDDGDWYLRSTLRPDDRAKPEPKPEPKPKPLYQAGVPSYEAYPQTLLNLNRLPTLRQRLGSDQLQYDKSSEVATTELESKDHRLWGRIEGEYGRYEPKRSTSSTHYRQDIFKAQTGFDTLLSQSASGDLFGGLNMQFSHGNSKIRSAHGDGKIKTDGYGVGATLTWYADSGTYVDVQAQTTWYRSDLNSNLAHTNLVKNNRGFGYGLSLEGGKRVDLNPGWSMTPQAQLSYSEVDFKKFTDPFGARVELSRGASLLGRLGVALDYDSEWDSANGKKHHSNFYGIANLEYEFLNGTKVNVANTGFIHRKERLGASVGLGVSNNWRSGNYLYAIYAESSVKTSLQSFGDSRSVMANIGLRIQW